MHALTDKQIRSSLVNATRSERTNLTLPIDFAEMDWAVMEFLGWRDPKLPKVAYLVVPAEHADTVDPVGIMLRLGDRQPRKRPQCSFCEDVRLPNDVAFYSARRAGPAGRKGNTLGTLICTDFQCNANVRHVPPKSMGGGDPEAVRLRRTEQLHQRLGGFAARVLGE